ncbi:annexin A6-like isoform X2 [Liolophura sinensis]|uniref:annexin A6-like isoform X2 n=1 Tax=Liolophura sinensis TaxID=3198878 RepID=UPI0031582846
MTSPKTATMPKTGFPTASKVLLKYEKQRAYRQHRQKMQDMRHGIDNSNPQQYPHLVVRMKRLQKEEERQMIIDHENELLVNKMRKIMTRKGRLDNWNDYEQKSLHTPYRERRLEQIAVDNLGIAKRLERVGPVYHVKNWEDDFHRHEEILERRAEETKDYDDVLTPRRQKRLSKTRQQRKARKGAVSGDEDKYEDDFESDNDSVDAKGNENEEKDSTTKRDRRDSSQERKEEEDQGKLPRIECRKKDKNSTKDKGTTKVSKLPAVSQTKKSEGGTTLAESDAKQLFRICKELDKPEDVFIRTLVRRSYQQRMQTKSKFRDLYDLDLMLELRQGLREPWVPLINALLTEKEASDVSTVHSALENKDISSVVEILCTRNTNSLNNLKEAYRKEYAISLESDISEKTKNPVQLLLLTLLKGGRMESNDFNEDEAEKDARELFESGEGRWTSDTGKFIKLVEQRNSAQFKVILNMFKQISGGKDILVSVRHDCHDAEDYVEAVSTLVNCSKGPQMYFCEKLHACKKLDDPSFVNILVSRAETDMPATRKVYKKRYGKELSEDISSRGPHVTLQVLRELANRPAPSQNSKAKTQGTRKPVGNQQTTQVKKPEVRKPEARKLEKRDEAAAVKSNPLNQPGKRVMAEAKHKREQEERAKTKQSVQKREKTKAGKSSDSDSNSAGTVHPAKDFSAEKDADKLFKAMDGLGTNENDIVQILPRHSNSQRQEIKAAYSKKYNRDLVEDLKSELSGDFEELILALMMTPQEYEAYCLNDAVRGLGTDEATLLGMLLTRTLKEIKAVKDQYQRAYKKNLEDDLAVDTGNVFKQMLLQLVKAEIDEGTAVDQTKAEEDARKLFKEETKSLCVTDGTLHSR